MREAKAGAADRSQLLRNLDAKQRQVLALFENSRDVTAKEIAALFGFQQRNAAMGEGKSPHGFQSSEEDRAVPAAGCS